MIERRTVTVPRSTLVALTFAIFVGIGVNAMVFVSVVHSQGDLGRIARDNRQLIETQTRRDAQRGQVVADAIERIRDALSNEVHAHEHHVASQHQALLDAHRRAATMFRPTARPREPARTTRGTAASRERATPTTTSTTSPSTSTTLACTLRTNSGCVLR